MRKEGAPWCLPVWTEQVPVPGSSGTLYMKLSHLVQGQMGRWSYEDPTSQIRTLRFKAVQWHE